MILFSLLKFFSFFLSLSFSSSFFLKLNLGTRCDDSHYSYQVLYQNLQKKMERIRENIDGFLFNDQRYIEFIKTSPGVGCIMFAPKQSLKFPFFSTECVKFLNCLLPMSIGTLLPTWFTHQNGCAHIDFSIKTIAHYLLWHSKKRSSIM